MTKHKILIWIRKLIYIYDDYYDEYNGKQWYETIKKLEMANYLFIEAAMKMMFPKLGHHCHFIKSSLEQSVLYDSINYKENLDEYCLVRNKFNAFQLHNIGDMFKPIACLSNKRNKVHPTCPCLDCVEKRTGETLWMCDSGASDHFTFNKKDFSKYRKFPDSENHQVKTANGFDGLHGLGTIIFEHKLSTGETNLIKLFPVLYMPKATACLISNGRLIHQGLLCQQDENNVVFTFKGSGKKYIEGMYLTPIDTLTFAQQRIIIMDPTLIPGPGPCNHAKSKNY